MIRWRGHITQIDLNLVRHRLQDVRVKVTFVIFDDSDPDDALFSEMFEFQYSLQSFRGMSKRDILNLVLNEGIVHELEVPSEIPPLPPEANLESEPDPPPLRSLGAQVFQEYLDAEGTEIPEPEVFGPR